VKLLNGLVILSEPIRIDPDEPRIFKEQELVRQPESNRFQQIMIR
jgi:hypothetical protein